MSITDGTVLDQTEIREIYNTIPAKYVVFKNGTTELSYYAKCTAPGGTDYGPGAASTIIDDAMNGLTGGRTWKEKIVLKGNITLDAKIVPQDYTVLEIQGNCTLANGVDDDMIENSDPSGGNSNIDIIVHGTLNGNRANQTTAGNGINFVKVTDSTIAVYGKIVNCFFWGLYMASCDRNQIPIIHVENSLSGVELENSDENQVGLVYVKNIDYSGMVLYNGCLRNTVEAVIGNGCGASPDPDGGGETFRIDNGNSYNNVGKIISYNSGYEAVRVEIDSLQNKIDEITVVGTSDTAGIDGVEIYDGANGTIIGKVSISGVLAGQGVKIDGCDGVQLLSGDINGSGAAASCDGVIVYNSNDCYINVRAYGWTGSGCHVKGSSARTRVNGNYCSNTVKGVQESDTADYTLLTNAVLIGNGAAHDVDAANSLVGDDII